MFLRQLGLLLWKNFTIRKRHPIRTVVEIIWPVLLFTILVVVRFSRPAEKLAECHYPARALPSAGIFPWIETMFCNLDNPCFNLPVASETPGQINDPQTEKSGLVGGFGRLLDTIEAETTFFENPALYQSDYQTLSVMIYELTKPDSVVTASFSSLMGDPTAVRTSLKTIGLSDNLIDTIFQSKVTITQGVALYNNENKRSLVCNETTLAGAVSIPSTAPLNASAASTELCNLSDAQLTDAWNTLLQGTDLQKFYDAEGQDLLMDAGLNSGLNSVDLFIFVTRRLPKLQEELKAISSTLIETLSGLAGTGNSQADFFTSLIGYDLSSAEGFRKFCGHPANRTQLGQAFLGSIFNLVFSISNSTQSEFCEKFVEEFETNDSLGFVWTILKPILFGKIPYTPDTNVTRDIMSRSNETFSAIGQMQSLSWNWLNSTGPFLYDYLENDKTIELIREILKGNLTNSFFTLPESQIQYLGAFLSNNKTATNGTITWKMIFEQLNVATALINKMLTCMNLDKFEGYSTEGELEQRSLDLLANNSFWAGIVFLSPTGDDAVLPKHIKYKIRQDVDDVMRTDFIRSYYWSPGPGIDQNSIRYLINGFADIQDMMDHGISRVAADTFGDAKMKYYGSVPKLGYYLQEIPYPCYTSDNYWAPGPNGNYTAFSFLYYTGGFLFLQDMLERGISSLIVNPNADKGPVFYLGMYLQEFPYPCYKSDKFLEYLGEMMSLLMTLAWIYSVCIMIKNIVYEKEERLKEFMRMMGLGNGVHWLAWFINSFYLMLLSCLLMVMVLSLGRIMPYSNPFILLIWLISFCLATIAQCFLISCFFTKANLAAACGGIIYFLLYIPYNFARGWDDELDFGGKIGLSLFSTVAFGYGSGFISNYEMAGDGMQFSNWNTSPVPGERYTFLISVGMMLLDAVIYFILTWYIENVFPGKYGIPRPAYFMFTQSYWCGTPSKPPKEKNGFSNPVHSDLSNPLNEDKMLEEEPNHLNLGVSIQNLTKIYRNGNKVAVDNLTLNFYEGQITSFLGHNGAGKTTTMSILCGLFPPTHGTAYIHGNDIRTDMDTIRNSLGMCPQHNVLFRDLSVKEHLDFYAGLRGADKEKIKEDTARMIDDVGLPHKRHELVHNLSGGMKRKLSVAVSFIGDSKTVILDEPTAGVDPYARRGIWDLLLKYREGRTIILSTHHMDEADLLGDRIAIISEGQLKCCGSSLFLKSTFGVGYYLTLVKQSRSVKKIKEKDVAVLDISHDEESNATSDDEGFASKSGSVKSSVMGDKPPADLDDLNEPLTLNEAQKIICSVVPSAKVHEENVGEITFILPYDAIREGRYADLFQTLDESNIGYGLTDTSLEEIFLSVADHKDETGKTEKSCFSCFRRRRRTSSSISPTKNSENGRSDEPVQLVAVNKKEVPIYQNEAVNDEATNAVSLEIEEEENDDEVDEGHSGKGSYKVKGRLLVLQQFIALMVKRFHHARRNRKGLFAQIILPSAFVLVALCFTLILPPNDGQPPLELHPWLYGDNLYTFYSNDNPANLYSSSVSDALVNSPSLGTRCMEGYNLQNFNENYFTADVQYLECVQNEDIWQTTNETKSKSQYANSNQLAQCDCKGSNDRILLAECPIGAGGEPTPFQHTNTTDFLYNMTERHVADWLVKTTDRFIEQRFGGLSVGEKYHASYEPEQIQKVIEFLTDIGAMTADNQTIWVFLENMWRTENGKVWFDNNGWHAMPAWLNVLSNGMLRSELNSSEDASEYGISVYNHPMNYTKTQVTQASLMQMATDTAIAIVVVFAMAFVPASFVIFLIDERVTKAKHLQFISGVNQTVYWIANFVWDMINYLIPAIFVIIIFLCFQTDAYVSASNLPCLVLLLLLYGWAITPMMYPFSFLFEVSSTAYVVLTCLNLFIGINTSVATLILQLLQDDEYLQSVNEVLQKVFLIFPHYCLGRGLIDMAVNQAYADAFAKFGVNNFVDPLSWDVCGKNLAAMAIEGFVFFAFNLLVQYRFFLRPRGGDLGLELLGNEVVEEDVAAEKSRILRQDASSSTDILRVTNLSKVYHRKIRSDLLAVDRMCVGVSPGECFGLLGVNGAGKTTTFKMLTGDESITTGDATICGMSIQKEMRQVQQNTGYCPQFDALNSHLTGFEHLQLYARLRGVPKEEIDQVAAWGIAKLGLKQYAHKETGTYSGGNKRKLSAAIAFIGCPPVIFLDEPTAGMDPKARRFLWKRISEVVKIGDYNTGENGRCVILTSHSMEECEALCTRLAIMVNGRFVCLGTPQHIKNKYGKGYTVSVRVGGNPPDMDKVQNFLLNVFSGATLKEKHHNMIVFQLPLAIVKLADVFHILETNKTTLQIEDYSVSQTTLDEVFVNFAKHQTDGIEQEGLLLSPVMKDRVEMTQISGTHEVIL